MSTIASQIERIKAAKSVLAKLATRLSFYSKEADAEAALIGDIAENLDTIESVSSSKLNAGVPAADGKSTQAPNGYYPGKFTITNLTPNNVRNGVTIMGIEGTMSGTEGLNLQAKSVEPKEATQNITPDSGYNGLSKVTVSAISSTYIGSAITRYDSEDGNIVLSPSNTSQAIAGGYYVPGGNTARVLYVDEITVEAKEDPQIITPENSEGVCFAKTIKVPKIPSNYIKTEDATATASDILSGKTAYVDGKKVTGNILTRTGDDLYSSGPEIFVPEGYYSEEYSASVATSSVPKPSLTLNNRTFTASVTVASGYVNGTTQSETAVIPSIYQDITVLEQNLDGIAANISFIGSDDRTKYGTAQLRSGAFEWDYRTSNTFTIPTGIYRDGESGSTSSMSWYENETSFQTWVEADRSTLPATDSDGQAFDRAYIVPCEGNGYITRMNGPYGIDTSVGGGNKYGVLFYNNTFYVVDRGGPNTGNERLFTHGYSYTISTAYVTFNALESALAAI